MSFLGKSLEQILDGIYQCDYFATLFFSQKLQFCELEFRAK